MIQSSCASIRGHSVIWRNANGNIIKQVHYNSEAVFTPQFPTETDEFKKLPMGIYDVHVITSNKINKILCTKRENISSQTFTGRQGVFKRFRKLE